MTNNDNDDDTRGAHHDFAGPSQRRVVSARGLGVHSKSSKKAAACRRGDCDKELLRQSMKKPSLCSLQSSMSTMSKRPKLLHDRTAVTSTNANNGGGVKQKERDAALAASLTNKAQFPTTRPRLSTVLGRSRETQSQTLYHYRQWARGVARHRFFGNNKSVGASRVVTASADESNTNNDNNNNDNDSSFLLGNMPPHYTHLSYLTSHCDIVLAANSEGRLDVLELSKSNNTSNHNSRTRNNNGNGCGTSSKLLSSLELWNLPPPSPAAAAAPFPSCSHIVPTSSLKIQGCHGGESFIVASPCGNVRLYTMEREDTWHHENDHDARQRRQMRRDNNNNSTLSLSACGPRRRYQRGKPSLLQQLRASSAETSASSTGFDFIAHASSAGLTEIPDWDISDARAASASSTSTSHKQYPPPSCASMVSIREAESSSNNNTIQVACVDPERDCFSWRILKGGDVDYRSGPNIKIAVDSRGKTLNNSSIHAITFLNDTTLMTAHSQSHSISSSSGGNNTEEQLLKVWDIRKLSKDKPVAVTEHHYQHQYPCPSFPSKQVHVQACPSSFQVPLGVPDSGKGNWSLVQMEADPTGSRLLATFLCVGRQPRNKKNDSHLTSTSYQYHTVVLSSPTGMPLANWSTHSHSHQYQSELEPQPQLESSLVAAYHDISADETLFLPQWTPNHESVVFANRKGGAGLLQPQETTLNGNGSDSDDDTNDDTMVFQMKTRNVNPHNRRGSSSYSHAHNHCHNSAHYDLTGTVKSQFVDSYGLNAPMSCFAVHPRATSIVCATLEGDLFCWQ
jgi:hypothetical protein